MKKSPLVFLVLLLCSICLTAFSAEEISFSLTDGIPENGKELPLAFTVEVTSDTLQADGIISMRVIHLDNGHYRCSLEHCLPKGYSMFIFGAGGDPAVSTQVGQGVTSGNPETVTFDVADPEMATGNIVISMSKGDDDRLFIFVKPEYNVHFPLTGGNPVTGAEESLCYSTEILSATLIEENIISLKKTQLDNGYSRYSLEHSLPEGYEMAVFGAGIYNEKAKLEYRAGSGKTSGDPETTFFDLPDAEAIADDSVVISIAKADDDRMFIRFHPMYNVAEEGNGFALTAGNPVDETETAIDYIVDVTEGGADESSIISLKKAQLDNGYSRYFLNHKLPAGYILGIFGPGNESVLKPQKGLRTTSGDPETVTFDVSDREATDAGGVNVNFYNTKSGDRLIVHFQVYSNAAIPESTYTATGSSIFTLTTGSPAGTEEDAEFSFPDETPERFRQMITGLKKISLDNGFTRFSLENNFPAGFRLIIFGGGDDPRVTKQISNAPTGEIPASVVFDLNDKEANTVGLIVLSITDEKTEESFFLFLLF